MFLKKLAIIEQIETKVHDAGINTISTPSNTCPLALCRLFFFGQLFGHEKKRRLVASSPDC